MMNLEKKVVLEFLGGIETFKTAYTIKEVQKIDCTGEYLIAK